jgi:hypothetical protein
MNLEARKPGMELGNFQLTERIIAAAIRVHKELGPGFLEIMYEEALAVELGDVGITFERQKLLPIFYHEHLIGEHRLDLLVRGKGYPRTKSNLRVGEDSLRHRAFLPESLWAAGRAPTQFRLHQVDRETRRTRISPGFYRRNIFLVLMASWFPDSSSK